MPKHTTATTESSEVVRLDMTIAQAQAVASALDFFTRISLGQFEEIATKFAHSEFKVALQVAGRPPTDEECSEFRSLCAVMKRVAGHPFGSGFGLGNRAVSEKAHSSYEVMKVLDRALAVHRDPAPNFRGVDYDGLTVRYTTQPAPRCVIDQKMRT
jgi:hypothetical protein